MDSGFSFPRMEAFPAGLRVLVVDDDLAWLRILEKMLKKCAYEVSACCLAKEALNLLRERKDGFDIVISDVNMPDMDGFKLLEHIGLELDLPVIMMSVDGETSRVMRGVLHGACDYLIKPIRMKELRNIWQHVLRKRIHEVRDIEGFDEFQIMKLDHCDTGKKRKYHDDKHEEREHGDPTVKKARVVWTKDLHQKFVTTVDQIGFDKVGPKKILDPMNVPRLTRENVASHLQKYRLYMSRLQEGSERKACFGATKQSDISTKEMKSTDPKHYDDDLKNIVSLPIQEQKKTPICNISDTPKTSILRIGSIHNFRPQEPNTSFDPMISKKDVQNEIPKAQFKKENVVNQLDHVPIVQFVSSRPSITESKRMTLIETKTQEASVNNQLFLHDPGSGPESLISESYLGFASGNVDLFSFFLQSDTNYKTNVEHESKECFIPNIPELFDETVGYLYYPQKLNYENQWEATEYPVMDQGLFII